MSAVEFKEWPKIPRLSSPFVVTEKIDGTNSAVVIEREPFGWELDLYDPRTVAVISDEAQDSDFYVYAQSRTRFITPAQDNHGFARWVKDNAEALVASLGVGTHFGEWWGNGIQRGYGLGKGDKRFSLFNVKRWNPFDTYDELYAAQTVDTPIFENLLSLSVVPILTWKDSDTPMTEMADLTHSCLLSLKAFGSLAARGYMNPEGVVLYHTRGGQVFKDFVEGNVK